MGGRGLPRYGDRMKPTIDLGGYFARIGYTGPTEPSLSLLRELCSRHLAAIPFECLDPFLGHAVDLDPAAIQAKLVRSRRGGYCHEHNALFHDVLATLGFSVTALGGRVVGTYRDRPAPLTHRLTLVRLADHRFVADVGAGGRTPPAPLCLEPGLEQVTSHGVYRFGRAGDAYELQLRVFDRWDAIYRFDLAPQADIDFEVANWYTSTNPRALFTQNLIVCRLVEDRRLNLLNKTLSIREPDGQVRQQPLLDARALGMLLSERMGIAAPVSAETLWAKLPA
jgi:N-hydroxyarylamine O-acetyltransferase